MEGLHGTQSLPLFADETSNPTPYRYDIDEIASVLQQRARSVLQMPEARQPLVNLSRRIPSLEAVIQTEIYPALDALFFFGQLRKYVPVFLHKSLDTPDTIAAYTPRLDLLPLARRGAAVVGPVQIHLSERLPCDWARGMCSFDDSFKDYYTMLLHEATHAFFDIFICKCNNGCNERVESTSGIGKSGHGKVFMDTVCVMRDTLKQLWDDEFVDFALGPSLSKEIYYGCWKIPEANFQSWSLSVRDIAILEASLVRLGYRGDFLIREKQS